ncbi:MAG TPA: DUF4239 domain-containing protein [Burkholderiales bacterium]|jgi:hypothetical protein
MLQIIDPAVIGGALAGILFVGILIALALGRWIGKRTIARHGTAATPNIGSLETAVFALLGLIIAFTFSGALSRFDTRRAQVVDEANAMGTAYLRIDLVPASSQPKLRDAFRSYVDSRIETYRRLPDVAAARVALARSQELQGVIWSQAIAAVRTPGSPPAAEWLVLNALNEMFNFTTARTAATLIHPPVIIYAMLIGLALASALLAGYQTAGEKAYDWVHQLGFAGIVALTLYVILEIEYPRMGFVRMDAIDQVLVDVRAGMK